MAEMASHILPDVPENEEIFYDDGVVGGIGLGGVGVGAGAAGDGSGPSSSAAAAAAAAAVPLPPVLLPPPAAASSRRGQQRGAGGKGPTCREPNGTLFRTKIRFLDGAGREWPITYERLRSAGQKHTRLSAGWRELCAANALAVGDTVRFSRYGGRGEDGVVLVEKEEEEAREKEEARGEEEEEARGEEEEEASEKEEEEARGEEEEEASEKEEEEATEREEEAEGGTCLGKEREEEAKGVER